MLKITSSSFSNMGEIPSKYTCDGSNLSPALYFENVPKEAQSLVLIVEDPDTPKDVRPDGLWIHWIVFNIEPTETKVEAGSMPTGIPGRNTGGSGKYEGPCPGSGEHRYFFKLFALDTKLDLSPGATAEEVNRAMRGHVVEKAELVGRYSREGK